MNKHNTPTKPSGIAPTVKRQPDLYLGIPRGAACAHCTLSGVYINKEKVA